MGSYFLSCNSSILTHPHPLGISPSANFRVPLQQNFPGSHRKEEIGISIQKRLHLQVGTDRLSLTKGPLFSARQWRLPALLLQGFHHNPLQFQASVLLRPLHTRVLFSKCARSSLKRMHTANHRDEGKTPADSSVSFKQGVASAHQNVTCHPAHFHSKHQQNRY